MSPRDRILALRNEKGVILPSLLMCDFGNLEREIRALEEAGVKALHLDVMDGVFVPNLTYGLPIVEAIRRLTDLPIDVHLMIQNPNQYLAAFVDTGADCITFHVEAEPEAGPGAHEIRETLPERLVRQHGRTPRDRVRRRSFHGRSIAFRRNREVFARPVRPQAGARKIAAACRPPDYHGAPH